MIEIEKGVPLLAVRNARRRYPLSGMAAGDSFFVPDVKDARSNRVASAVSARQRRHGGCFTTSTVTENNVKGVRVWCLVPSQPRLVRAA